MIRLLTTLLLLTSITVSADTQVPHTFENGEVISADEFNQNFDTLETAIDGIPAGATGPAGPAGPAGAAGATGPAGADSTVPGPQGATGPLVLLVSLVLLVHWCVVVVLLELRLG